MATPKSPNTPDDDPGRAIPLIALDPDTGRFQVSEESVDYLANVPHPIAIVSIAGMYRTGKSFLMNVLLNKNKEQAEADPSSHNGFQVGSSIQACTKGLWMWTKPIVLDTPDVHGVASSGKPTHVIFVDTEGIGATTADTTHDTRIFALSMLLSSLFVYNSVGSIDEQALSNLSLVTNVSRQLQSKVDSTEQKIGESPPSSFSPRFFWVVRDFALQLQNAEGSEITPSEYLEAALEENMGASDEQGIQKNQIRSTLKHFFTNRECALLVRPCSDESKLQQLKHLGHEWLRPEFVSQATLLRDRIYDACKTHPFCPLGQSLDGRMFLNLCESYVQSINEGTIPVIRDVWSSMCESQRLVREKELESRFKSALGDIVHKCVEDEEVCTENMFDEKCLHLLHQFEEDWKEMYRFLYNKSCSDNPDLLQAWKNTLRSLLDEQRAMVIEKMNLHFKEVALTIQSELTSQLESVDNFEAFYREYQQRVSKACIPTHIEHSLLCKSILVQSMNFFMSSLERKCAQLSSSLEQVSRESGERLKQERTELLGKIKELEDQLQEKDREYQTCLEKYSTLTQQSREKADGLENKVLEQTRLLERDRTDMNSKCIQLENELDEKRQEIRLLTLELEDFKDIELLLKSKEEERAKLEEELLNERSSIEHTRSQMQMHIESLEERNEWQLKNFQSLEQQSADTLEFLKQSKEDVERSLTSKCTLYSQKYQDSMTELNEIRQKYEAACEKIAELESGCEALKLSLDKTFRQKEDMRLSNEATIQQLRSRVQSMEASFEEEQELLRSSVFTKEQEWLEKERVLETRLCQAESQLESKKRQLEQTEQVLSRKRQRQDNVDKALGVSSETPNDSQLQWLRNQLDSQQDALRKCNEEKIQMGIQLQKSEAELKEKIMFLKLSYERKIAELESQVMSHS